MCACIHGNMATMSICTCMYILFSLRWLVKLIWVPIFTSSTSVCFPKKMSDSKLIVKDPSI